MLKLRAGWKEKQSHTILFCRQLTALAVITVTSKKACAIGFCEEQPAVCHSASYSIQVCLEKQKQKIYQENRFFYRLSCAKTTLEQYTQAE